MEKIKYKKRVELSLKDALMYAEGIVNTVREPLIVLDPNLKVVSANKSFYKNFEVNPKETEGQFIYDLGNGQWNIPKLRQLLKDIITRKSSFNDYEITHIFEKIGSKTMLLNARRIPQLPAKPRLILLAIEDITKRKAIEGKLSESANVFRSLFLASHDAIMTLRPPLWKFTSGNPATLKMFRAKSEREFNSCMPWKLSPKYQPDGHLSNKKAQKMINIAMRKGSVFFEWAHKRLNGEEFLTNVLLSKVEDKKNPFLYATVRDITEQKKANQSLKESEESFRAIFESGSDGILLAKLGDKKFYLGNKAICKMLGYSLGEIKKLRINDIHPKKDLPYVLKQFAKQTRGEITLAQNLPVQRKNGSIFYADINAAPIKIAGKSFLAGFFRDNTERKETAEKLKEAAMFTESTINSITDIFYTFDLRGKFLDWNKTFNKVSGYSDRELSSKKPMDFFSGKDIQSIARSVKEIYKKGTAKAEANFVTKDGRRIPFEFNGSILKDGKGNIIGFSGTGRNLSEHKKLEQALEDIREAKEKAILEAIGDGVMACDKDGKIILFNHIAAELSGFSIRQALGKHYKKVLNFINEDMSRPSKDFISQTLNEGRSFFMVNHAIIVRKDGTKIPIADSAAPIFDKSGKIKGCVVVFRNVTREREVDRAKTEFVSLASHQLRTPLASINWLTEMLLNGDFGEVSAKQKESIATIYKSGWRMANLVSALLNVSRLELGTFSINTESVVIKNMADETLKELEPQIIAKKVKIVRKYPISLPTIKADPVLLKIIWQNLLSNAVRYSLPETNVTIAIEKDKNNFLLTISDQGIGIAKEDQSKIFNKLFRASNAQSFETNGTGLGLYIVKLILNAVGGKIWFDSAVDKGTSFYVALPLKGMQAKKGRKSLEISRNIPVK